MWSEQDTAELLTHEKGGVRPIGILNLAKLAPLFRDESAYDQFIVTMMQMIASNELIIVATNDNVIATMRSAIDVREAFQWRISSRLAEDPHAEVIGPEHGAGPVSTTGEHGPVPYKSTSQTQKRS
jgi:hypothetical protein